MKTYRVEFAIDVVAESPTAACQRAWDLMTQPDALQPVGTVIDPDSGDRTDIDLQEFAENEGKVLPS